MLQLSFGGFSRTQTQLMVQGLYLLIGILLIVVGVECLDAGKIAIKHPEGATPKVCTLK
ncbi:MAG: hypothetical protein ABFD16_15905 [Thermoguttaceae bacterium]